MEAGNPLLDDYVLSLTHAERPEGLLHAHGVAATPTTTSCASTARSRRRAASPRTSRCSGATRAPAWTATLAEHLLEQDLIYVGGGSVVSLLGVWRAHGLDEVLRRVLAARRRAVRPERRLAVLVRRRGQRLPRRADVRSRGLGLLPHSNCVHYDGEPARREAYRAASAAASVAAGYAADDGVALHFIGTDLARVVASRRDRAAYRVESVEGEAMEVAIEPDCPGAAASPLAVA